jgi:hypothetical protein
MAQDGTGERDAAATAGAADRTLDADPAVPPDQPMTDELSLDPRVIARASLAAGRNSSLWWVTAGVAVAVAVAVLVSTAAGALVLAGLLAVGAVVRAATPSPGPAALVARSRPLDVLMLFAFAFALAILSQLIPTR